MIFAYLLRIINTLNCFLVQIDYTPLLLLCLLVCLEAWFFFLSCSCSFPPKAHIFHPSDAFISFHLETFNMTFYFLLLFSSLFCCLFVGCDDSILIWCIIQAKAELKLAFICCPHKYVVNPTREKRYHKCSLSISLSVCLSLCVCEQFRERTSYFYPSFVFILCEYFKLFRFYFAICAFVREFSLLFLSLIFIATFFFVLFICSSCHVQNAPYEHQRKKKLFSIRKCIHFIKKYTPFCIFGYSKCNTAQAIHFLMFAQFWFFCRLNFVFRCFFFMQCANLNRSTNHKLYMEILSFCMYMSVCCRKTWNMINNCSAFLFSSLHFISFKLCLCLCVRALCTSSSKAYVVDSFSLFFSFLPSIDESLTCNVCDRAFHCHRQLASHQQKKRHFG